MLARIESVKIFIISELRAISLKKSAAVRSAEGKSKLIHAEKFFLLMNAIKYPTNHIMIKTRYKICRGGIAWKG